MIMARKKADSGPTVVSEPARHMELAENLIFSISSIVSSSDLDKRPWTYETGAVPAAYRRCQTKSRTIGGTDHLGDHSIIRCLDHPLEIHCKPSSMRLEIVFWHGPLRYVTKNRQHVDEPFTGHDGLGNVGVRLLDHCEIGIIFFFDVDAIDHFQDDSTDGSATPFRNPV
jgi:hypothetical protein